MIEGLWKLIVPNPIQEKDAVIELYNLKRDAREVNNVASQNDERVKAMRNRLDSWWNPSKQGEPRMNPNARE